MKVKYSHHAHAYDERGWGIQEPWGDQEVYGDFTEEYCGGPEEQLEAARKWAQTTWQNTPRAMTVRISVYKQEPYSPWTYDRHVETIERTEPAER